MRVLIAAVACVVVVSGCAGFTVKRLPPDDTTSKGVRYFGAKPYLFLGTDGKATVIYLPDKSAQYAVTQRCGIGSNKLDIVLTDGWSLSKISSESGEVPAQALDLLSKIFLPASEEKGMAEAPQAGFYEIVYDTTTFKLTELRKIWPK